MARLAMWMAAAVVACSATARAEEIKHRFLMMDESRHAVRCVDQSNPDGNWDLPVGGGIHDFQLIGRGQLLVSQGSGYTVYDLATRKVVKELKLTELNGTMSVRARPDGTKLVGANQKGIVVFELDAADKVVRKMAFPALKALRMLRLTADGNVLLAEEAGVTEVAFDPAPGGGKIVHRVKLPRSRNAFMALKSAGGNYLVGAGFAQAFLELTPEGKVVRDLSAAMPAPLTNKFCAGFHVLPGGDVVVCNWTGHAAPDSKLGWQMVQFDKDGKVVWKWHDPQRAGTAIGVIVLDGLDANAFHHDVDGVLKPAK